MPTVKKLWLSVYRRVAKHFPELAPDDSPSGETMRRGKEKKHHLVAYLREYTEELRPVSRKMLRHTANLNGAGSDASQ